MEGKGDNCHVDVEGLCIQRGGGGGSQGRDKKECVQSIKGNVSKGEGVAADEGRRW